MEWIIAIGKAVTCRQGKPLAWKSSCLYLIILAVTFVILVLLVHIKLNTRPMRFFNTTPFHQSVQPEQCTPARNIFFLKVHKAGSSTVGNTLGRYAWLHNLTLATHRDQPFESSLPHPMVSTLLPRYTPTLKYNIMNNHAVYHNGDIHKILHSGDKLHYLTIIREPVARMMSYLNYYPKMRKRLKGKYIFQDLMSKLRVSHKTFYHLRNTMAFEFGIPTNDSLSSDEFVKKFRDIESKFLVLITEYFHESLVLLKRKYCWGGHNDILYLHIRHQVYPSSHPTFEDRETLCQWSTIDCFLYNYFNQTFWKDVNMLGADFQEEVTHFKNISHVFDNYCKPIMHQLRKAPSIRLDDEVPPLQVPASAWSPEFTVSPSDCALLYLRSAAMVDLFYLTQNPAVCRTLAKLSKCPWDPHMRLHSCLKLCDHGESRYQILYRIWQDVQNTMLAHGVWVQ